MARYHSPRGGRGVARCAAQRRARSDLLRPLLCCRRRVEYEWRRHVGEALRVEPATVCERGCGRVRWRPWPLRWRPWPCEVEAVRCLIESSASASSSWMVKK